MLKINEDSLNLKLSTIEEQLEKRKKEFVMTTLMVRDLLEDFNVKSEQELNEKLNSDNFHLVRCVRCGKVISLFNCSFYQQKPICKNGDCEYEN